MRVLVIGSGGREHALVWRLAASASVDEVLAWPGNAGIAQHGRLLEGRLDDLDGIVATARRERIDLVVIGPEAPLVAGLADRLRAAGVAVFGPSAAAAQLEGSKVFSKNLFRDAGIPTAEYEVFDNADAADRYLGSVGAPIVVKADGLCAGKGALVCPTLAEAHEAVDRILRQQEFGAAGDRVVIEECLTGPEISVMALVDGATVVPLPVSQDHKRVFDGDRGPNTGGMGAYSPVPAFSDELIDEILATCLIPTAEALVQRGTPYQGVLYGGYLLTEQGIRTLEYNCRFGDPEAQVILPRLGGDFGEVLLAAATGRLDSVELEITDDAAVCVVMASGGYPAAYPTGLPIEGLDAAAALDNVVVFHAGTRREAGRVVTSGGRVLGVTAWGTSLPQTIARAYRAVDCLHWEGCHARRDIAAQAT